MKSKKDFNEIKKDFDKKINEEIKKAGVFFAFSNKQFEENRTYKNIKDMKYLSIGYGGYIAKKDKPKYDNFNHKIYKQLKDNFIKQVNKNDFILYELYNHECYYTYELEEVTNIIKDYYNQDYQTTYKEVKKVFDANKKD